MRDNPPSFRQIAVRATMQYGPNANRETEPAMSARWKKNLRNAAIVTALIVPGGCIALLAVALVKKVR